MLQYTLRKGVSSDAAVSALFFTTFHISDGSDADSECFACGYFCSRQYLLGETAITDLN